MMTQKREHRSIYRNINSNHRLTIMMASSKETDPLVPPPEITIDEAMKNLLLDEDFSDVKLLGNDDVEVPAYRGLLATRSRVFKSMLCGNYSEASAAKISIDYPGNVLKGVVEYIYTNDAALLTGCSLPSALKDLALLAAAALYFELPGLSSRVKDLIDKSLKETPKWSVNVLAVCSELGPAPPSSELRAVAMSKIRTDPRAVLTGDRLSYLSADDLEKIVSDGRAEASELTLFRIVKDWMESNGFETQSSATYPGGTITQEETKALLALRFMKHIDFPSINPEALSTVVFSSGLVSDHCLYDAYLVQSLSSYKKLNDGVYDTPRFPPSFAWKRSGGAFCSDDDDVLECPRMTSGRFGWTIEIVQKVDCEIGFGIHFVGRFDIVEFDIVGNDWIYKIGGSTQHYIRYMENDLPPTSCGDKITLRLDLQDGNGFLKTSINGGKFFELRFNFNPKFEILPRVTFDDGSIDGTGVGKVCLLSYKRLG